MKKDTNFIIAAMISTAVLGVAIGYGITFWEHWQASQNALSGTSASQNSMQSKLDEKQGIEPAVLDAPRKLSSSEEVTVEESALGQIQSQPIGPYRS